MVEQLYEPLREKNGGLISIKFEEMRQKLPLSLIFEGKDSIALIISALVYVSNNYLITSFSISSLTNRRSRTILYRPPPR